MTSFDPHEFTGNPAWRLINSGEKHDAETQERSALIVPDGQFFEQYMEHDLLEEIQDKMFLKIPFIILTNRGQLTFYSAQLPATFLNTTDNLDTSLEAAVNIATFGAFMDHLGVPDEDRAQVKARMLHAVGQQIKNMFQWEEPAQKEVTSIIQDVDDQLYDLRVMEKELEEIQVDVSRDKDILEGIKLLSDLGAKDLQGIFAALIGDAQRNDREIATIAGANMGWEALGVESEYTPVKVVLCPSSEIFEQGYVHGNEQNLPATVVLSFPILILDASGQMDTFWAEYDTHQTENQPWAYHLQIVQTVYATLAMRMDIDEDIEHQDKVEAWKEIEPALPHQLQDSSLDRQAILNIASNAISLTHGAVDRIAVPQLITKIPNHNAGLIKSLLAVSKSDRASFAQEQINVSLTELGQAPLSFPQAPSPETITGTEHHRINLGLAGATKQRGS